MCWKGIQILEQRGDRPQTPAVTGTGSSLPVLVYVASEFLAHKTGRVFGAVLPSEDARGHHSVEANLGESAEE